MANGKRRMATDKGGISSSAALASHLSPLAFSPLPYYRLIAFGIFWFFITLSVESSVIPIVDVIFEHRVYLPSVGAFVAVAGAVFLAAGKLKSPGQIKKFLVPAFSLVIIIFSVATYARNMVWQNEASLWRDVVSKSPNKARGHSILGVYYAKGGKTGEALNEFETAVRLDPSYVDAHKNLARALYAQADYAAAEREYRTVLALNPDHADARNDLGCIYFIQGRFQDAEKELTEAVRFNPQSPMPHTNLGKVYYRMGRLDMALNEFRIASELAPDSFEARRNFENVSALVKGKENGNDR